MSAGDPFPRRAAVWDAVDRHRKVFTALLAAAAIAAASLAESSWPEQGAHESIEALGFLLLVVCTSGRMFTSLYIRGRKNCELVQLGPYSVVRNPLYACSILGCAAIGLCIGSLVLGVTFAAAAFVLFSAVVRAEERRLLRRFSEAYSRYMREVPRWIPDFRRWHDAERWEMTPALVARAICEGLALVLLVALIKVAELAHLTGVLPVMVALP